MALPNCLYQKAFWVAIPLLVVSFTSGIAAIDAEINGIDERLRSTELQVAENDVPTVKAKLDSITEKINDIQLSNARIEQKIDDYVDSRN